MSAAVFMMEFSHNATAGVYRCWTILDTEGVSRDERLHLNFASVSGKVLPLSPS